VSQKKVPLFEDLIYRSNKRKYNKNYFSSNLALQWHHNQMKLEFHSFYNQKLKTKKKLRKLFKGMQL